MKLIATTPRGTTVSLKTEGVEYPLVILDHPEAPELMRNVEAGRVIDGGFQPIPFGPFTMTGDTLRAIATALDEVAGE